MRASERARKHTCEWLISIDGPLGCCLDGLGHARAPASEPLQARRRGEREFAMTLGRSELSEESTGQSQQLISKPPSGRPAGARALDHTAERAGGRASKWTRSNSCGQSGVAKVAVLSSVPLSVRRSLLLAARLSIGN